MQTTMKAENPNEIFFEMKISMSLKEWKELNKQLENNYPSWQLKGKITEMVNLANSTFYPEEIVEL